MNNAFLNGHLKEEVYMVQPLGFESNDKSLVCKLERALYGLKQVPRAWFEKLAATLYKFGFAQSKCDSSLFMRVTRTNITHMLVYVDDIIITGSSSFISRLKVLLHREFTLKDLGSLNYFLGIEAIHSPTGDLTLTQQKYVSDLLKKAGMSNCKPTSTPMVTSPQLIANNSSQSHNPQLYRSIVGSLHYATITHPKISFAVNKVSQFMVHHTDTHWNAVKRILWYLKGTLDYGLKFTRASNFSLCCYADADWATDLSDRKSTSGFCVYLGPNLITWYCKKQSTISRSSIEAEYRSVATSVADLIWIQSLLRELRV